MRIHLPLKESDFGLGHTGQILRLDAMRRTMIARTMVRFSVLRILINIVLLWSVSDTDN